MSEESKSSAFVTKPIEGEGSQSAVGKKPLDVVSRWVRATWKRDSNIQLPFQRTGTLENILSFSNPPFPDFMIEELVNGERTSRIRCLSVPDISCAVTFSDSTSMENLIAIFEHLKVFHSIVYDHYHDNIHLWSTPTPKKVRMHSVRKESAEENGCSQMYRSECFEILLDDLLNNTVKLEVGFDSALR